MTIVERVEMVSADTGVIPVLRDTHSGLRDRLSYLRDFIA